MNCIWFYYYGVASSTDYAYHLGVGKFTNVWLRFHVSAAPQLLTYLSNSILGQPMKTGILTINTVFQFSNFFSFKKKTWKRTKPSNSVVDFLRIMTAACTFTVRQDELKCQLHSRDLFCFFAWNISRVSFVHPVLAAVNCNVACSKEKHSWKTGRLNAGRLGNEIIMYNLSGSVIHIYTTYWAFGAVY